jgi:hypothetical protein
VPAASGRNGENPAPLRPVCNCVQLRAAGDAASDGESLLCWMPGRGRGVFWGRLRGVFWGEETKYRGLSTAVEMTSFFCGSMTGVYFGFRENGRASLDTPPCRTMEPCVEDGAPGSFRWAPDSYQRPGGGWVCSQVPLGGWWGLGGRSSGIIEMFYVGRGVCLGWKLPAPDGLSPAYLLGLIAWPD